MPWHRTKKDSQYFLHIVGRRNIILGISLAFGAVVGWSALTRARDEGNYNALLWLGFLVLALVVSSMLCVALPLVWRTEASVGRSRSLGANAGGATGEYQAKYSTPEQLVSWVLPLLFGGLICLVRHNPHHLFLTLALVIVFCGLLLHALQVTVTTVRFTDDKIHARSAWFKSFSEPYTAIQRLRSSPGTIVMEFSDGQCLKIRSGLGNAGTIVRYLQTRCPKSVKLDDSSAARW